MRRLLLIGCVAALALAASAYAAFFSQTTTPSNSFTANSTFCVSPGTTANGTPDNDSFVDLNNPTTNNGASISLTVDGSATKTKRAYVHFSLPTPPHNCSVSAATLSLNDVPGPGGAGRTHQLYQATATWTELGITWNNQPGFTGSATTATSASGWVNWDATAQTQALYSGTNTGFVVKDSAENAGGTANAYSSRTGANPPQLVITWG